jgi:hypothetical protein
MAWGVYLSDLIHSDAPRSLHPIVDPSAGPSMEASHDAPVSAGSLKILSLLTKQVESSKPRRNADVTRFSAES